MLIEQVGSNELGSEALVPSAEYIALACFEIGFMADRFDEGLVERFGGETMLGESRTTNPYGLPGYL